MMDIFRRVEAIPVAYPATPSGLSPAAAALDAAALWQRIEGYVAHRWTAREVIWVVAGWGSFEPDLTPATITAQELWDGTSWQSASLLASPLDGLRLDGDGPYRITAGVGGGGVPAGVTEAYRRLAEYLADPADRAGVSSYTVGLDGTVNESYQRNPAWIAKAIQLSGAGDLLRQYRRV